MSAWDTVQAWFRDGAAVARRYPLPTGSVDVSADLTAAAGANVDYSTNPLRAIYVGDPFSSGSSVYVKMLDDSAFIPWDCVKGECIKGVIVGVGASTTATKLVGLR